MNKLINLYTQYTGSQVDDVQELLPLSGSNRRYFRLTGKKNLIGVSGTSEEENNSFIYIANH